MTNGYHFHLYVFAILRNVRRKGLVDYGVR